MMRWAFGSNMLRRWGSGAACLLALSALAGCGEVEWNWGDGQSRPVRPAGQPVGKPAKATASAPAAPPVAANKTAPQHADEPGFYQLVLLSEPAPAEAPPGLKHVRLKRAPARPVGEVLAALYVPTGPTGTDSRYTLLYPSTLEWNAAALWAAQLDFAPVSDATPQAPADVQSAFAFGVGVLYGTTARQPNARERYKLAVSELARVLNAADQPAPTRWAAGMIAAAVLIDRLYDFDQAVQLCQSAEAVAQPGSHEQMSAMYTRARAHIQNGQPAAARQVLDQVIAQFSAFRKSEVFDRAQKTLADMDKRKK